MNANKQALMKIFSLVLRERAKSESESREISPEMVKFFSRKELIEIIHKMYNGVVPKEFNLVELENEGLLKIIADDFYIISYVTEKWSKEIPIAPIVPVEPIVPVVPVSVPPITSTPPPPAANPVIPVVNNNPTVKKEDPKLGEKKN